MSSLFAGLKQVTVILGILAGCAALAADPENFASPDLAVEALVNAAQANDPAALIKIFGSAGKDLVNSGDRVADQEARALFFRRYGEGHSLTRESETAATLVIGAEEWPFPIPLVRRDNAWHFDTEAGEQEILDRRIGRNELNAKEVCRSYVQAQLDYAADIESARKPVEYAQKFVSSPGLHDGLYWPAGAGEKESPIGPLMMSAHEEGYVTADRQGRGPAPYHGYFYRILTRQGHAAPGGARDYVIDGHMTGGFALVAFPAKYGDSGVMTFIVNQSGIVYEKDLGSDTANQARAITSFDPDPSWHTR